MSSLKIGDLFVALGIEVDPKAMPVIDNFIGKVEKPVDSFGKRFAKSLGRAASNVIKGGIFAGVGAIGAGFVGGTMEAIEFDEALTDLEIASQGAMGTASDMRRAFLDASSATGVAKEQLVGAAASFVALTGDGAGAAASLDTFAKVSIAAKTPIEDVSAAAAAMKRNMGIDARDFEQAFSILIKGGKAGAVELDDMARNLAELAPLATQFKGGTGIEGLTSLGAAFQTVMKGAGSADKAKTRLERFMEALSSPRTTKFLKSTKGGGIKVFEGKGDAKHQRNMLDILDELADSPIAKDPELLNRAFESTEARAAARQLLAVRGAVRDTANETRNATDAGDDYAAKSKSASFRLKKAWNDVKISVAEAFTPERVKGFTDAIGGLLSGAVKLVGVISKIGQAIADHIKFENIREGFVDQGYSQIQSMAMIGELEESGLSPEAFLARRRRPAIGNLLGIDEEDKRGQQFANLLGGGEVERLIPRSENKFNATFNVTAAPGQDAQSIARSTRDMFETWFDTKLSEAVRATP